MTDGLRKSSMPYGRRTRFFWVNFVDREDAHNSSVLMLVDPIEGPSRLSPLHSSHTSGTAQREGWPLGRQYFARSPERHVPTTCIQPLLPSFPFAPSPRSHFINNSVVRIRFWLKGARRRAHQPRMLHASPHCRRYDVAPHRLFHTSYIIRIDRVLKLRAIVAVVAAERSWRALPRVLRSCPLRLSGSGALVLRRGGGGGGGGGGLCLPGEHRGGIRVSRGTRFTETTMTRTSRTLKFSS